MNNLPPSSNDKPPLSYKRGKVEISGPSDDPATRKTISKAIILDLISARIIRLVFVILSFVAAKQTGALRSIYNLVLSAFNGGSSGDA